MFDTKTVSLEWGGKTLTLETGRIARQADGAVLATYGETVVLCAVTAAKSVKEGQDFFPLTVHYQEKFSAAGRIPGGFFKREGRATEKETLTSRLIDRPVRPLFPEGFYNEINVIAQVLSYDGETEPDIVAMIAASAAQEEQIACIHQAAGFEPVQFGDADLQQSYDDHVRALLAPKVRAETESFLRDRGLLELAPTLDTIGSLKELVVEIERLCGFEAGTMLKLEGDQLTIGGHNSAILEGNYEQAACLLALIRHSGITNFGFIGNEKDRDPDDT